MSQPTRFPPDLIEAVKAIYLAGWRAGRARAALRADESAEYWHEQRHLGLASQEYRRGQVDAAGFVADQIRDLHEPDFLRDAPREVGR